MIQLKNFLIKREQSQACLSFAKREKSRLLAKTLLTLVALLAVTTGAWAQEVTKIAVGGSTQNNNFVPLPGNLAQNYTKCEFVYPATMLTALNGYDITRMTFGASAGSQSWGDARFQVFLKEVDFTTISAYSGTDNATTVYEGVLYLFGTHEMEITFTIPYTYHGGNLLIGVYQTVKGNNGGLPQWLGENATGASVRGYNSGSLDAVTTATQCNFLPKVTFTCVSSAAAGPEVTWNAASKTGTFDMPGGNVELEPEYYPQAELAMSTGETPVALAPAAIDGVPANTDDPIVTAGTVANIGTSEVKQGTLMYFVSQSTGNTAPEAPDYDTEGWSEDVPTANGLAQGNVYVWYYIKGAEPANINDRSDENTRSDSDIMPLGTTGFVTLDAEPTYTVEFAEGIHEPDKWSADPNTGVKKGQTVTVTYSGTKKVLGVKAEKKAPAPALLTLSVCGETIYYAEGETWAEAIQNHPTENQGWEIYDGDVTHDNLGFLTQNDDFVPGTAKIDPNASYGNTGV